jgi:hypothetical protein
LISGRKFICAQYVIPRQRLALPARFVLQKQLPASSTISLLSQTVHLGFN